MAVQVDAHAGPVQPGGHLFNVGGLARAVQALQHDPAVVFKTRQEGQRDFAVEAVIGVDLGHMLRALAKGGDLERAVDVKNLAHIQALQIGVLIG